MGLSVRLEVFEGPLDLLLYLIEKNKIDIYDIPIVVITVSGLYPEYADRGHECHERVSRNGGDAS